MTPQGQLNMPSMGGGAMGGGGSEVAAAAAPMMQDQQPAQPQTDPNEVVLQQVNADFYPAMEAADRWQVSEKTRQDLKSSIAKFIDEAYNMATKGQGAEQMENYQ